MQVRTPRAGDLQAALLADGASAVATGPGRIEVTGSTPERVAALAADRSIPIIASTTGAGRLEDVFLQLTSSPDAEGDTR